MPTLARMRFEPRGTAPALPSAGRPGFVAEAAPDAVLERTGQPLARRRRPRRDRMDGRLAGSGIIHLILLVLLSVTFTHPPGGAPQQAQPVEMMYENPGKSGSIGQPRSAPPPKRMMPAEKPLPDVPPPMPVPPVPAPPVAAAPPLPLPDVQSPEALPKPLPPAPTHRQTSRSVSPLSQPMDLSFAQNRPAPRRSTRFGSGGAINLSLGPMVQNGHLLTPYASTTSIRGISSDYDEELSDWIHAHMYYPQDAAERGEDGPSSVHVVLDRQGHVTSIRLVNSSGSYALDDATQGMFRGATLPPVPPDMSGDTFDIDLTIDYILIRR